MRRFVDDFAATARALAPRVAMSILATAWLLSFARIAVGADDAVTKSLRRVLTAPEAVANVVLERSDPFGGPPERERGQVWYVPGRGLRYRADGSHGIQLGLDREGDRMLLYRPAEPRL